MQCPSRKELTACLLGKLADARADSLLQHAEDCDTCGRVIQSLENASDHVTEALRNRSGIVGVSAECERMIDRAEIYVQAEYTDETVTDVKPHLLQGKKLRDYEIIRPLGEGGMGAVFLARHGRLDRDVAVKVLSLGRAGHQEAQKRFEQEMSIVGKLQHPNIVRALDAGEHEGVQYLVMEVIDGVDLRQLVDAMGPIPLADACEICRQAAKALSYAHGEQLIHRDVKPSNIMLASGGLVKVMDLGLARFTDQQRRSLTSTQQAMGSLDFMAPEQLRAEEVDHRADVYGLACTLHFLLVGEPPEKRRTASLMVSRNPKLESLRGLLPPPLLRLMQQMLAVDRNKRIGSAADVAAELAPFCSRSDLPKLLEKANRVGGDKSTSSESITSSIEKPRFPTNNLLFWWLAGAAIAATLLFIAAGLGMLPSRAGNSSTVMELADLTFESSNVDPTREIPLFQIHEQAVRCVDFSPTTKQLICGSDDGAISVRELPNQPRIQVLNYFSKPVERIAVIGDGRRFVCQDQRGSIAVFQLPSGNLEWSRHATEFANQPIGMVGMLDSNQVVIGFENGMLQAIDTDTKEVSLETVANKPIKSMRQLSMNELELTLHDGSRQWFILPSLVERRSADPSATHAYTVNGQGISLQSEATDNLVCAVDGTFARLVDVSDTNSTQFIYAEHSHPITAVFAFPGKALFLTADKSGEIRLWHARGRPSSDMLMRAEFHLDSREMTFGIRRKKHRWSKAAFARSDLDTVNYEDSGSEIRVETEIQRDGQRHVLEYRINKMAAHDE